jgi:o-succinylbenzoate synthase
MRRIRFAVRLRVPVLGVTERSGWLVEGDAGWGEYSPLPSWSPDEVQAAERAATEAAELEFPAPVRTHIDVNAMVPRVAPDDAARLALDSGCKTVKVKVGDELGLDRVAAVRAACGPAVKIRVDANGAWDVDEALRQLLLLRRYDIELAEDPVASIDDIARVRRKSPVPIAVEMIIRTVDDAARLNRREAADAVVLKPQRIGGVRAALQAADAAGIPAIASSALETSVGLCAVLALAAALPDIPFAHGIGTALLLETDVTSAPLLPIDGALTPRRVVPDAALAAQL